MDCKRAEQLLEICRAPRDELDGPEDGELASHIEQCPACLERYRACRSSDARIARAMQAVAVPGGLCAKILAGLDASVPRPPRRVAALPGLARVLVAAGVLVALGTLFWSRPPHPGTRSVQAADLGEHAVARAKPESARWVPAGLESRQLAAWCLEQLEQLRVPPVPSPERHRLVNLVGVARASLEESWVAVFLYRDPRGPELAEASNADVFACPRSRLVVTGLSTQPLKVYGSQGRFVFAWVEGETVYVAVLKGWVPRAWEPLDNPRRPDLT
jgi:hypothetical protein